jgi:OmpA-OmpF porin, OOP family
MKTAFLLGAGVAVAMTLSSPDAKAQLFGIPGGPGVLYLGGEGGWSMLEDANGSVAGVGFKQRFDDGFNLGARVGYEMGPWRFEEEFSYRDNGQRNISALGATVATNGSRKTYAFMTNAIYDFTLGWPVTPHIGGGIGAVNLNDNLSIAGFGKVADFSDWVFGYQGIAGIRYNINPTLVFDVDYRFVGTTDPHFRTTAAAGSLKYRSEHISHSILANLSYRFAPPPPPPPPQPVAAPAPPPPPPPPPVIPRVRG